MKDLFRINTKTITGTALLVAVELVLIVISNYTSIGPVNINLALVPIALAGMLFGPLSGLFIGVVNGVVTILSPSTQALFMSISPFGTVLICLLKTGLAGFISGLIYYLLKGKDIKNSLLASFLASLIVPIVNTGIFTIGCYTFFYGWLGESSVGYDNTFLFLIYAILGWNFLIEFLISVILSPSINMVVNHYQKRILNK